MPRSPAVLPYARESQAATLFAHVSDPVPAPSSVSATLSPFDAVVQRAMAKDPDDRYASAAEFAASLAAVSTVTEAVPPPPPVPQALGDPGTPWGDHDRRPASAAGTAPADGARTRPRVPLAATAVPPPPCTGAAAGPGVER